MDEENDLNALALSFERTEVLLLLLAVGGHTY